MKVKKLENFQNKIGLKGCKWSSLKPPGTETPLSHAYWELGEFPFPMISPLAGQTSFKYCRYNYLSCTSKEDILVGKATYGNLDGGHEALHGVILLQGSFIITHERGIRALARSPREGTSWSWRRVRSSSIASERKKGSKKINQWYRSRPFVCGFRIGHQKSKVMFVFSACWMQWMEINTTCEGKFGAPGKDEVCTMCWCNRNQVKYLCNLQIDEHGDVEEERADGDGGDVHGEVAPPRHSPQVDAVPETVNCKWKSSNWSLP